VTDVHHRDHARLVVDPVDDAVGAAPSAEPVIQRRKQPLADAMWLFQQWAGDELLRSCRRLARSTWEAEWQAQWHAGMTGDLEEGVFLGGAKGA
jgi:hypothetical protein